MHGPIEQELAKACEKTGRPLPPAIVNAPELLPGLELFYAAFTDLCTCRAIGMSVGPIPWDKAMAWGRHFGLSADDLDYLWDMVSALDDAYMRHLREDHDRSRKARGGRNSQPG